MKLTQQNGLFKKHKNILENIKIYRGYSRALSWLTTFGSEFYPSTKMARKRNEKLSLCEIGNQDLARCPSTWITVPKKEKKEQIIKELETCFQRKALLPLLQVEMKI